MRNDRKWSDARVLIGLLILGGAPSARAQSGAPANPRTPNSIQSAVYFNATPRDATYCEMRVVTDKSGKKTLVAAPPVTNPAMTCPDMFSWKLFADALGDDFLQRWASDSDTFPGNGQTVFPWPLCTGTATTPCCRPGANNDPTHCPLFPGAADARTNAKKKAPLRRLRLPALQNLLSQQHGNARLIEALRATPAIQSDDPTRRIRQEANEIVFRNQPMFNYILDNGIYYSEGLARVFANATADVATNAPYHRPNAPRDLTTIEFPADAVMIKADFLTPEQAQAVGLKNDPSNPIIRVRMLPPDQDLPQEYWLVSFHVSSKDTPQWVWTTFEYAGNIGRCDFTGCNDSYGFAATTPSDVQSPGNYQEPNTTNDGFQRSATIFALNGIYPAGTIRPKLATVLDQLGIGTGPSEAPPAGLSSKDGWFPSARDKGWRSYRLKGSQVNFTDAAGRTLHLGNSVTESGFVTTSSCITCHARANINKCGGPALGVFEPRVEFQGYPVSSNGTPNAAWFNASAKSPTPLAVQTDFVWGFLSANATTKDYKCVP